MYHPLVPVHLPADVYRYMIGKEEVRGRNLPSLASLEANDDITGTLAGAVRALTRAAPGDGAEDRVR